jgi:hypothetical protein
MILYDALTKWGPSGSLMQEITEYSFNGRDLMIIMEVIDKRLNDSGKNWRHVFKVLLGNKGVDSHSVYA